MFNPLKDRGAVIVGGLLRCEGMLFIQADVARSERGSIRSVKRCGTVGC